MRRNTPKQAIAVWLTSFASIFAMTTLCCVIAGFLMAFFAGFRRNVFENVPTLLILFIPCAGVVAAAIAIAVLNIRRAFVRATFVSLATVCMIYAALGPAAALYHHHRGGRPYIAAYLKAGSIGAVLLSPLGLFISGATFLLCDVTRQRSKGPQDA